MNSNPASSNEAFAARHSLDVGERYISTYGVEMEVSHISLLGNEKELLVEFAPVNEALREMFWWGVFLGDSHIDSGSNFAACGALFNRE